MAQAKQAAEFGATTNPGGAAKLRERRPDDRRHDAPFEDEATDRKMQ
jgi:hypothetical protein